MSKKDKSKFRKRIQAQILQEMSQIDASQKPNTNFTPKTPIAPEPTPAAAVFEKSEVLPNQTDPLRYVKSDLKKSAVIIGSIIIIIVALYIVNTKTQKIDTLSEKLFKAIHLNI